jgi:metal-sulfur cluster biosynthetic enzyme
MTSSNEASNPYKLTWDSESSYPELSETVRESLRQVIDPEIGLNIIELGLIRDLQIENESAEIKMILTTPFCPYAPAMMEMTRKKAEETLERPVSVEIGMEMWDPTMMEEGAGADWGLF